MGILGSRQNLGAAALLLAGSAFLSRLMGLARDKIISWQFGAGSEADMYFAAFIIPDIINYLLAGGFISITIIPLLAKGFRNNAEEAWRFFSCVLTWFFLASCLLTGAAIILASPLAAIVAPGFNPDQTERLAFFMRIILPAQIFFLTGAAFTALLLLRRQFLAPSLTPLIYNGFIILTGILLPWLMPENAHPGMTGYCIGVSLGAFFGAFLLPCWIAVKNGVRISLVLRHPWMKRFLFIAMPLMLGQTVIMLDEQFLRIFGSMIGEGAVSLLNYARRISQVPVALMGQAIATASYPFLVNLLANNEREKFAQTLNAAINSALLLIIPCAALMIACSQPILAVIFQGGRFSVPETLACQPLAAIMLAATPFWIVYMALVRGYYALEDTITPALTGTVATIICIPLYYMLAVPLGTEAVAALSALGVSLYVLWLCAIWIRRMGRQAFKRTLSICWRMAACSLPGALLAYWLANAVAQWSGYSFTGACMALTGGCLTFAASLWPMSALLMPEFLQALRKRLAGKKG